MEFSRDLMSQPITLGGRPHRSRQQEARVAMNAKGTSGRWWELPSCRGPVVLVLALGLRGGVPSPARTAPVDTSPPATRQRFLEMWARSYYHGRTGKLL